MFTPNWAKHSVVKAHSSPGQCTLATAEDFVQTKYTSWATKSLHDDKDDDNINIYRQVAILSRNVHSYIYICSRYTVYHTIHSFLALHLRAGMHHM